MRMIIFIAGLSLMLLTGCRQAGQETKESIVIDNDSLIITDIHGESLQLTGAVKDSLLAIFEVNNVLESTEAWTVIKKLKMPDQILPLPLPEGFEDDTTAYSKDYSEYGNHYYDIFVGKTRQEKEQYLISIDPATKVRRIGNYWDLSFRINEDKTKILELWIYR